MVSVVAFDEFVGNPTDVNGSFTRHKGNIHGRLIGGGLGDKSETPTNNNDTKECPQRQQRHTEQRLHVRK